MPKTTREATCTCAVAALLLCVPACLRAEIALNEQDYLEARGLSVLLYHNAVHGVFFDQKLAGLEIILHGERIATNGDIRLLPTPQQWDPVPQFKERTRGGSPERLTASRRSPCWSSIPSSRLPRWRVSSASRRTGRESRRSGHRSSRLALRIG